MDNVEIVKEITRAFCDNRLDQEILRKYFAPEFTHVANGRQTDLSGYSQQLSDYQHRYERFSIPNWDELFAAGDKVVASYTLEAEKKEGEKKRTAVMAVWRLTNGKVTSLREVDAPTAN